MVLARYPRAQVDNTFADMVLPRGFIDPDMYLVLGGMLYGHRQAPPRPMAVSGGMIEGYP